MNTKTYTKTPAALDRLIQEIQLSSIAVAVDISSTSILGDQVTITFKADLSESEWSVMDGIVAAHTGVPLVDPYVPSVSLTSPKDSDGSFIMQPKTTKLGWHYSPRTFVFQTGTAGSLRCLTAAGAPFTDIALKFFGANDVALTKGAEETDEQFQTRLDTDCIATAVDWWPNFDLDIISGAIKVRNPPTNGAEADAWLLFAPAIPAQYGGSVPFGNGGTALSMFENGELVVLDGRGAKRIVYDPVMRTNEMRGLVRHTAGVKTKLMVTLGIYRA